MKLCSLLIADEALVPLSLLTFHVGTDQYRAEDTILVSIDGHAHNELPLLEAALVLGRNYSTTTSEQTKTWAAYNHVAITNVTAASTKLKIPMHGAFSFLTHVIRHLSYGAS